MIKCNKDWRVVVDRVQQKLEMCCLWSATKIAEMLLIEYNKNWRDVVDGVLQRLKR